MYAAGVLRTECAFFPGRFTLYVCISEWGQGFCPLNISYLAPDATVLPAGLSVVLRHGQVDTVRCQHYCCVQGALPRVLMLTQP